MSILVPGGRGKTSGRLAALLDNARIPFILASRSKDESSPYHQVKFDWFDQTNWDAILKTTPIKAIYLIAPPGNDPLRPMHAFVEKARSHGVGRFVLLSTSALKAGDPVFGKVHQYLIDSGIDYAVLRPTWFMENCSEQQHFPTIKNESKMYSATQDGKLPWISCVDIAAAAFRCLTDEKSHNTDHVILGPELFSYDETAEILSEVLGRKITHVKLTVQELADRYVSLGYPREYSEMLADLDGGIAQGTENRLNDEVEKVTGRPPRSFRSFVEENQHIWL